MKTVNLWHVPLSTAKKIVELLRQEAAEKMADPNFSISEMRTFLYHAEQIEEAVREEETEVEDDDD